MAARAETMITLPRGNPIVQVAWVVPDLEQAALQWTRALHVGPFFLIEHPKITGLMHRGVEREMDCSFALAQAGRVQVELIMQHDSAPSAYRDTVPAGRMGFHHVAAFCDYDTEVAAYQELGFEIAQSGCAGDLRYCYVDTSMAIGCMVELLDEHAPMRELFARVASAAESWDGRDPLRRVA